MSASLEEFVVFVRDTYNKDITNWYDEFTKRIKEINVFTDGSVLDNKNSKVKRPVGGVGVFISIPGKESITISEPVEDATNNKCELEAINRALAALKLLISQDSSLGLYKIVIYSDSAYSIGCCTSWFKKWEENNWITSKGTPVENQDIIKNILKNIRSMEQQILFRHVKAHSGIKGNEMADALAVSAAKKYKK